MSALQWILFFGLAVVGTQLGFVLWARRRTAPADEAEAPARTVLDWVLPLAVLAAFIGALSLALSSRFTGVPPAPGP